MYVQKVTGMHLVEGLLDCIVHAHKSHTRDHQRALFFIDRYAVFSPRLSLSLMR